MTQEQYQHAVRRQNAAAATASPSERISALTLHRANIRSGGAGRYAVHWRANRRDGGSCTGPWLSGRDAFPRFPWSIPSQKTDQRGGNFAAPLCCLSHSMIFCGRSQPDFLYAASRSRASRSSTAVTTIMSQWAVKPSRAAAVVFSLTPHRARSRSPHRVWPKVSKNRWRNCFARP